MHPKSTLDFHVNLYGLLHKYYREYEFFFTELKKILKKLILPQVQERDVNDDKNEAVAQLSLT